MSKVAIKGNASGTGTFTLEAPNSNSDRTLTLPDEAGTVLTSASDITSQAMNGPAFRAYKTSAQTVSNSTDTKITFTAESFDTDSAYDTSTSRFIPNLAGYYMIGVSAQSDYIASARSLVRFKKNGSAYQMTEQPTNTAASTYPSLQGNILVYMNGSTDYIEVWWEHQGGIGKQVYGNSTEPRNSVFYGHFVRS